MPRSEAAAVIRVVCEAPADAEMATTLADRVLVEKGPDWVEGNLVHLRAWRGFEDATDHSRWRGLKGLADKAGIPRMLGRDPDIPKGYDGAIARKAILLARPGKEPAPLALLLVRDLDNQPKRRLSLEAAANKASRAGFPVLLATPDPEREAWVLHGFEPQDESEEQRLAAERERLGFDPRIAPQRLRGDRRQGTQSRDIKAVLSTLVGDDPERERQCLEQTSLGTLRQRGEATHLAAFLEQVEADLLPRLGS